MAWLEVDEDLGGLVDHPLTDTRQGAAEETGYILRAPLGTGGFAVTFLADVVARPAGRRAPQPAVQARAVVKIARPGAVARLPDTIDLMNRKETVALQRIGERVPPSPHVVRLFEAGRMVVAWRSDPRREPRPISLPWNVLEYIDGGALGTTLFERLQRSLRDHGHAMDPQRVLGLTLHLLDGLEALHEYEVVHRDIKPENLLICGDPPRESLKIADLGIAAVSGLASFQSSPGTAEYAPPEQFIAGETGPYTDVFAVGAVVYELLTGDPLFPDGMRSILAPARPSIRGGAWLHPSLRTSAAAPTLEALDKVIAAACSVTLPGARAQVVVREGAARLADIASLRQELIKPLELLSRVSNRPAALTVPNRATESFQTVFSIAPSAPDAALTAAGLFPDGTALGLSREALWYLDVRGWQRVVRQVELVGTRLLSLGTSGGWRFGTWSSEGVLSLLDSAQWRAVQFPPGVSDPRAVVGNPDELLCVLASMGDASCLVWFAMRRHLKTVVLPQSVRATAIAKDGAHLVVVGSAGGQGWLAMTTLDGVETPYTLDVGPLLSVDSLGSRVLFAGGQDGGLVRLDADGKATCQAALCSAPVESVCVNERGVWVNAKTAVFHTTHEMSRLRRVIDGLHTPCVGLGSSRDGVDLVLSDGGLARVLSV